MVEISDEIAVFAYGNASNFKLEESRNSIRFSIRVSKEILLDLVKKNIAEFSIKFFHFQYATLEMFKGALNNYSMLKLLFKQHPPFCNVL